MKTNISLKWFEEEKKKELQSLVIEEQQLKNQILRKKLGKGFTESTKPYKTIKLVNDVLIVVLNNGEVLTKSEATVVDFNKVKACTNELQVVTVMGNPEGMKDRLQYEKDVAKNKAVAEGFELLKNLNDFEVKDSSVYLKGINRTLPALLVEKFAEIVGECGDDYATNDEYIALKRFFMWCCLNPRAEVADKLYDFLSKNGMRITKQGFFVALRNVVDVGGEDSEIVHFISNAYNKVKGVWKKNPKDFRIIDVNGEYKLNKTTDAPSGTVIGNLQDLYVDLPNMKENRFTDNWTKTFDIRIGKVVTMPMSACNWSTQDCAASGLHFAGYTAPYVLCGDTTVFTLHNPMKVVGIGEEKGRCYEYLPFMTTTVEEADEIMNSGDFDFLQLDEEYAIHELEGLETKAKEGFTEETKKHQFNLSAISNIEMTNIIKSLSEMKNEISKRVVNID